MRRRHRCGYCPIAGICQGVEGHAMALALSCWPLTPSSHPGQSMWDLWWSKWHWVTVFCEFFCFPLSVSFHCDSPYSRIIWGWTIGSGGGHSSETSSHLISMNTSVVHLASVAAACELSKQDPVLCSNHVWCVFQVAANADCVLSGYLQLKTNKLWVRRWFALHPDFVLYSFRSHKDQRAMTATPIPGYTIAKVPTHTSVC
jgi:hypothetical protein